MPAFSSQSPSSDACNADTSAPAPAANATHAARCGLGRRQLPLGLTNKTQNGFTFWGFTANQDLTTSALQKLTTVQSRITPPPLAASSC